MTLLMLLAVLLVFCPFYKIIVSCITKCMLDLQIKLMMIRSLEMIDQIYSAMRSISHEMPPKHLLKLRLKREGIVK